MELDYQEIGRRIREARMKKFLGQAELAHRIGISQSHMSNLEHGNVGLTLEVLCRLALLLDCSLDGLVLGKGADWVNSQADASAGRFNDYRLGDLLQALELLKKF